MIWVSFAMDKSDFRKFSTQIISVIKTVDVQSHKPTHASAFLVWYSKPTSDVTSVVELGSGTGVVAFSLAKLYNVDVVGVEVQEELYRLSLEGRSLNNLDERVHFVNADIQNIRDFFKSESFDMVVCNLPFHVGKESTDKIRRISRNSSPALINSFVKAAAYLLRNRGTFVFVTAPKILVPLMDALSKEKLIVQRMCFFHGTIDKNAKLVALKGKKNGGYEVTVDPPQWGEVHGREICVRTFEKSMDVEGTV